MDAIQYINNIDSPWRMPPNYLELGKPFYYYFYYFRK